MAKILNSRIQHKIDTAANWTSKNPVLLSGEIGIESDTNKIKVGNGTSTWSALGYIGGTSPITHTSSIELSESAWVTLATIDNDLIPASGLFTINCKGLLTGEQADLLTTSVFAASCRLDDTQGLIGDVLSLSQTPQVTGVGSGGSGEGLSTAEDESVSSTAETAEVSEPADAISDEAEASSNGAGSGTNSSYGLAAVKWIQKGGRIYLVGLLQHPNIGMYNGVEIEMTLHNSSNISPIDVEIIFVEDEIVRGTRVRIEDTDILPANTTMELQVGYYLGDLESRLSSYGTANGLLYTSSSGAPITVFSYQKSNGNWQYALGTDQVSYLFPWHCKSTYQLDSFLYERFGINQTLNDVGKAIITVINEGCVNRPSHGIFIGEVVEIELECLKPTNSSYVVWLNDEIVLLSDDIVGNSQTLHFTLNDTDTLHIHGGGSVGVDRQWFKWRLGSGTMVLAYSGEIKFNNTSTVSKYSVSPDAKMFYQLVDYPKTTDSYVLCSIDQTLRDINAKAVAAFNMAIQSYDYQTVKDLGSIEVDVWDEGSDFSYLCSIEEPGWYSFRDMYDNQCLMQQHGRVSEAYKYQYIHIGTDIIELEYDIYGDLDSGEYDVFLATYSVPSSDALVSAGRTTGNTLMQSSQKIYMTGPTYYSQANGNYDVTFTSSDVYADGKGFLYAPKGFCSTKYYAAQSASSNTLSLGSSGQVLTTNGAKTYWAAPQKNVLSLHDDGFITASNTTAGTRLMLPDMATYPHIEVDFDVTGEAYVSFGTADQNDAAVNSMKIEAHGVSRAIFDYSPDDGVVRITAYIVTSGGCTTVLRRLYTETSDSVAIHFIDRNSTTEVEYQCYVQ
jgi:hypothetical protein